MNAAPAPHKIAYLVPDLKIPFWHYLRRGIDDAASATGLDVIVLQSLQKPDLEMQNARDAVAAGVKGIIISPIDSYSSPAVLNYCNEIGMPVILADLGTKSGEYLSYVKSDNVAGAYGMGKALALKLAERGWENEPIGIVSIRHEENRAERFEGFRKATKEAGIGDVEVVRQLDKHNADYAYLITKEMLASTPGIRGIFVMADHPTYGTMRAIEEAGLDGQIIVAAFDAEIELVSLIRSGRVIGTGMQQPYAIGVRSAELFAAHFRGETIPKVVTIPTVVVTTETLSSQIAAINQAVFAGELVGP